MKQLKKNIVVKPKRVYNKEVNPGLEIDQNVVKQEILKPFSDFYLAWIGNKG